MPGFKKLRPRRFRSVWLSDVHLEFRGCNADALLAFLKSTECETHYLAGDIVDIWQLKKRRYWPQVHNDVIRAILGKAQVGTKLVYVPGNHDEFLRDFTGHTFGNITIVEKALHTRADGSKRLVLHGDQFDAPSRAFTRSRCTTEFVSHLAPLTDVAHHDRECRICAMCFAADGSQRIITSRQCNQEDPAWQQVFRSSKGHVRMIAPISAGGT